MLSSFPLTPLADFTDPFATALGDGRGLTEADAAGRRQQELSRIGDGALLGFLAQRTRPPVTPDALPLLEQVFHYCGEPTSGLMYSNKATLSLGYEGITPVFIARLQDGVVGHPDVGTQPYLHLSANLDDCLDQLHAHLELIDAYAPPVFTRALVADAVLQHYTGGRLP